jgi:hypothetical protein
LLPSLGIMSVPGTCPSAAVQQSQWSHCSGLLSTSILMDAQGVEIESTMRRTCNDMAERQLRMDTKADLYEKRHEAASKMVGMLREAVREIFNRVGCNTATVRELLGDNGITESNLLPHLGIVEQRTTELVHVRPLVLDHTHLTGA